MPEWQTGLVGVDGLLGGLRAGDLWVFTGAPSSGKSTLLTQLVFALAVRHGIPTDYFCSRSDRLELTRSRLLSLAVHRAPRPPSLEVPLEELHDRQEASLAALRDAPLNVFTGGGFTVKRLGDTVQATRCLAIDDPEGKRPPVLDVSGRRGLRQAADEGAVVLVTVPRSHCLEAAESGERLREEWASVADLVIELVPGNPGDTTLVVRQNRRGPLRDIPVLYLWHQARFVDRVDSSSA